MIKNRARAKDWQKADSRVLGQILAAQNIEFVLPDTNRLAEFFAETLITIPGIAACRVCLEDVTIQKGKPTMGICPECKAAHKKVNEASELSVYDASFKCWLADQPSIQSNAVDSLHHHFGFFVFQINDPDAFQIYKPFIGNLANHVAISLENRLQRDLLQKAREELEYKIEERTRDLVTTNLDLQKEIENRLQIEENLKQMNERFSLATRASHLGVWDWDIQKDKLVWDDGMYALYGAKKEDFAEAYDAWLKGVHPDDRIASDEISKQAQRGEREYDTEFRVVWPDGSVHYLKAYGQIIRDTNGRALRMTGVNFDITERRQTEDALRESEKRYRLLLNSVTDYIYTVQIQDGHPISTTHGPGCVAVTGYKPEDYRADPGLWYRMIYESDRVVVTEQAAKILAGETVSCLEHRIIHRDGSMRWVRNTPVPRYNQQRQLIAYDGLVEDITERKQAEDALRESEIKFRTIFESSVDAIGVSKMGIHTFVNPAYLTLFGYASNAELVGKSILDLIAPTHREQVLENIRRRASEQPTTAIYETRGVRKDGSEFDMEVHVSTYELNGEIYTVPIIRDITERKSMEDALVFVAQRGWYTGAEKFFDSLAQFLGEKLDMDYVLIDRIDENPDVAETVALYAKGEIVPNMRYALKGTPCENVLGRQLCVYPHGIQQLFPDDTLLPEMGAESYIGIPLWDSTGQPVGLIAAMSNKPLLNASPTIQLLQLVATRAAAELERERSNRLLQAREHEFRTLAENLPDNIIRYDREGRIVYVNSLIQKTMGISAQRMIGKRIREMYPDGSYEIGAQAVDAAIISGANGEVEFTMPGPGKEKTIHQIRTIVERNEHGEVTGALAIGRDITEHKRAEEEIIKLNQELEQRVLDRTAQLEAANKELEAFAYSVSHDLRAPLRHIDGFIELLQKRTAATLDEKSQHYMATVSESAKRMDLLIDDLLSFSRMGRNEMSKTQVDLGRLVQDVIREFKPEIEGRNIRWKISPLPIVIGDGAMLRVVLVNLISNALKFTRPRTQAEIEIVGISDREKEFIVFVRDNGVGFDKQYVDRLFGVFQRLHHADEFEGTGIGLANVRRVISRHGGRTWAEGEIGHGATFYFSLPQPKEQLE